MAHDQTAGIPVDLKRERDFEKLFEDHYRAVKSFFFRQGCSEDDSQDLTQEVFISAYGALDGFRGESNTRTWLTRIARNRLLNFLRERRAGKRYEPPPAANSNDDLAGELPDPKSKNPEEELLAAEAMALLQASIAELPFKMRRCMQLRAEKELQYKEIAKAMGVSIETIKSHLHQARVRLEGRAPAGLDRGADRLGRGVKWFAILAFLLGYLARGPAETKAPILATASSTQLLPGDFAVLGIIPKAEKIVCPLQDGFYSWVLTGLGPTARPGTPIEIEVAQPGGGSLRHRSVLKEFGEINLVLPWRDLPDGDYLIRVNVAAGAGGQEVTKEYRLTLDCP